MEPQVTTTAERVTPKSVGIRYGLINGIIGIVIFLALTMSGVSMMEGPGRWVGVVVSIVILVLAHMYFKKTGDGYMTYGQGVGIAFWMGLISSVLSSIFTYIYVKFIDTGFMDAMRQQQEEAFAAQGMSDEQIEQAMQFAAAFSSAEAILVMGLIMGIIGMVIIGLIVSIFTKNQSPETAI